MATPRPNIFCTHALGGTFSDIEASRNFKSCTNYTTVNGVINGIFANGSCNIDATATITGTIDRKGTTTASGLLGASQYYEGDACETWAKSDATTALDGLCAYSFTNKVNPKLLQTACMGVNTFQDNHVTCQGITSASQATQLSNGNECTSGAFDIYGWILGHKYIVIRCIIYGYIDPISVWYTISYGCLIVVNVCKRIITEI